MNSREGNSQLSSTSEYLVMIVTFSEIVKILKILMQRVIKGSFLDTPHQAEHTRCTISEQIVMESTNVVINDEQFIEDHSKVIQNIQDKPKEVEDVLPKEYGGRFDDQELQVLNDVVSKPTTPICERIQGQVETSTTPEP